MHNGPVAMSNLHRGCKVNHGIPLFHIQHLSLEMDKTDMITAFFIGAIDHYLSILKTWDGTIVDW